jgi:hypothetical protein
MGTGILDAGRFGMHLTALKSAVGALALCVAASQLHAEVLVYRIRLTSATSEADSGVKSEPAMPASMSLLAFIDLDTDCWTLGQDNRDIYLNDSPSNKSFSTENPDNSSSFMKFGFYARGTKYFLFGGDWGYPEPLTKGLIRVNTDFGTFQTQGVCVPNVDIGTKKSPIPADTVVTMLRGDAENFKKFVFSLKFDSSMTKDVNLYLKSKGIRSSVSGQSKSIPAAKGWLMSTYLPKKYPGKFPYDED